MKTSSKRTKMIVLKSASTLSEEERKTKKMGVVNAGRQVQTQNIIKSLFKYPSISLNGRAISMGMDVLHHGPSPRRLILQDLNDFGQLTEVPLWFPCLIQRKGESLLKRQRTVSENQESMTLENYSTIFLVPTFDKIKIKILEKEKG